MKVTAAVGKSKRLCAKTSYEKRSSSGVILLQQVRFRKSFVTLNLKGLGRRNES
jgi:hypothetical protein